MRTFEQEYVKVDGEYWTDTEAFRLKIVKAGSSWYIRNRDNNYNFGKYPTLTCAKAQIEFAMGMCKNKPCGSRYDSELKWLGY